MTPPWWAALPPAEARVRCGTGEHVLRWADGRLTAPGHPDADGELVLAALGGEKAECVAMLEAWGSHAGDLDVLALGPRSPADELAVTPELVDELRAAFGPAARSVPMRPGPLRGGARPGARALRGMPMHRLSPEQERARARRVELLSLFALGRDFQFRLSAQVAAAWSGGVPAGPVRDRRNAQPALVAALAGGWPRRRGRGSASTQTKSGPACTRGPGGAASSGTGPGCGRPCPSAGWPGCGRRVSLSPTVTWSSTCSR